MGPPRVDVTLPVVNNAARNFAIGQHDLAGAYRALSGRLDGCGSMAGGDKAAYRFAAAYAPAAQSAYRAFHTAIEALGGTSLGLTQTINNHLAADHHSRADAPGGGPLRCPPQDVLTGFAVDGSPPVVTGFNWAPSTTLPRLPLPTAVRDFFATSPDWPQGNPDLLDRAGNAWHAAAGEIGKVASWLNWTISTILDPADNSEYGAISDYWATLYKPADSSTVLSGLSTICQGLAESCHAYAAAIRKALHVVEGSAIVEIVAMLGGEAAEAALARVLRPILRRIGAYMLRTAVDIGTRYGVREAEAEIMEALANTKIVKAVEADFGKNAGKKLGADIAKNEGENEVFSGPLVKVNMGNRPDLDAEKLAERIGGEPNMRFESSRREFDAVSDEYIGQAKPANYRFSKIDRRQAKASFEAAQQTGRSVYYHFDGPPDPSVIRKLNEYSQRYDIRLVVDTDPF